MRVVFWGSPAFAVATLETLLGSRHEVVAVVTQPARPRGRGREPRPTVVARSAEAAGVLVLSPEKPRGGAFLEELHETEPDVFVVAAYGEILSQEVLDLPRGGALNVHASLLPAYRGAAPVTKAILDGCETTGITIMRMEAGLDTGPICLQEVEPIGAADTAGTVTERLAIVGARLAVEALDLLERGELPERPQDDSQATHAPKITTDEARIDWSRPAVQLERAVRAYDPWPGAWTTWRGERIKIYRLGLEETVPDRPLGTVASLDPLPVVNTGEGAVSLTIVQPGGRGRMAGGDWARGRSVEVGDRLG